jgi:CubicO group peptidase (beta-lactamase class C family)
MTDVTPAFAPLAAHFARSVAKGPERGALCVMRHGKVLLDITGGQATPHKPWGPDTLGCCFSMTKGVLSLLAHVMIDRGEIALETRISAVWPAFATQGKGAITLHDVLTHRAGLPAVSGPVAPGDLYDWGRMVGHLEQSAPVVPVCAATVYHNMTYGHLLGEALRRAAEATDLSTLLAERITAPLATDFLIGLGPADQARCAQLTQTDPAALFRALDEDPDSLFARSMAFFARDEDFNSALWRGAVIGSGSGHATARALATLYGQFIWPDAILSPARQLALRAEQTRTARDPVLGLPLILGQGVERNCPPGFDFGPGPDTVGHWGAGGAQAFADPATGLSFAYVTGHMSDRMGTSRRAAALVRLLYQCLEGAPDV